jgi:hypothetical protein
LDGDTKIMCAQVRGRFIIVALVAALACDRGYSLAPVGWTEAEGNHYSRDVNGLRCVTSSLGGLIGEWWVDADLMITNAERPVRPLSVVLKTAHGDFPGKLATGPYTFTQRDISAPAHAFVGGKWEFSKSTALPEILGKAVTVEYTFAYGSEVRTVLIHYGAPN